MMADQTDYLATRILAAIPLHHHPDEKKLQRETLAWFDQQSFTGGNERIRERLRSSEFAIGIAAAFPWATYEAVFWWSQFTFWYMAFEEVCGEKNASADPGRYMRTAGKVWLVTQYDLPAENSDEPLATALHLLLCQLAPLTSTTVTTRIRRSLHDYLFAAAWDAIAPKGAQVPTLAEYRNFRRHSGLALINLDFIEHSPLTFLTDEQHTDMRIQTARVLAADIIGDINDLYSLSFEIATDNVRMPKQEGRHQLHARIVDNAASLIEITNSTACERQLNAYCLAVCDWVSGATWWHREARRHRYAVEQNAATGGSAVAASPSQIAATKQCLPDGQQLSSQ